MVAVINMHDAKTHLSDLVKRAHKGEEIVIAVNGKPTARLVPINAPKKDRPAGGAVGSPLGGPLARREQLAVQRASR